MTLHRAIGGTAALAAAVGMAMAAFAQPAPAGQPAASSPSPFAPGEGQAQTQAACSVCHAASMVTGKQYSAQKWGEVVDQMIDKGAKVSDTDYDTIVAYLAKHYGPAA